MIKLFGRNFTKISKEIDQLKAGAILSYVIIGLTTLVGLVYTPYMLRKMGQSEFGLYSLVASVIAYLTILDFGFGNAIIRFTSRFRAEGKQSELSSMFGMFITLYSLIGLVTLVLGLFLYFNIGLFFNNTMTNTELGKARIMILIMIFNLAVTFPFSVFGSIITAYERFVFSKSIQILRIILNTIVMVIILELGYRAIGMVIIVTIFNLLTLFSNYIYTKKKLEISIAYKKFNWNLLKEVSIYSFYIFLNIIMDRIYWSSGQFILGSIVGTASIAVFAVAIQLQTMYMNFSVAISGVFLPRVTTMAALSNSEKSISDLFIRTGRIQYIVMSFILTGFILFGRQFIVLWAGPDYKDAYIIALLFFIPLTVPLIQNLGITILQARNQLKFRSLIYVVIAILSLGLQFPLAKLYGGIGCAIGIAIALVLGQIIIMNIYYFYKQGINIPEFWKEIFKMSVVPIIVATIFYFLLNQFHLENVFSLSIGVIIFCVIYFFPFWIYSMNDFERNLIKTPIAKILKLK